MIVYTPIFYCAELKLAFKGKLTWKVADTLHNSILNFSLTALEGVATFTWQ